MNTVGSIHNHHRPPKLASVATYESNTLDKLSYKPRSVSSIRVVSVAEEIKRMKAMVNSLADAKRGRKQDLVDISLRDASHHIAAVVPPKIKERSKLTGHFGKVYDMDVCHNLMATIAQDGMAIVWDLDTGEKLEALENSSYGMKIRIGALNGQEQRPDNCFFIAKGGLDNAVEIFPVANDLDDDDDTVEDMSLHRNPSIRLKCHKARINDICLVTNQNGRCVKVLSASADNTIALWDFNSLLPVAVLSDHSGEINSVNKHPFNPNLFGSCGSDCLVKIWDTRSPRACLTYGLEAAESLELAFFPQGNSIAVGGADGVTRFLDLRCYGKINEYNPWSYPTVKLMRDRKQCSARSLQFSSSGRVLVVGYDNGSCLLWDTLKADTISSCGTMNHCVSSLRLIENNSRIVASCFDGTIRSWDVTAKIT